MTEQIPSNNLHLEQSDVAQEFLITKKRGGHFLRKQLGAFRAKELQNYRHTKVKVVLTTMQRGGKNGNGINLKNLSS